MNNFSKILIGVVLSLVLGLSASLIFKGKIEASIMPIVPFVLAGLMFFVRHKKYSSNPYLDILKRLFLAVVFGLIFSGALLFFWAGLCARDGRPDICLIF